MTSQIPINDITPRTQSISTNLQTVFDTDWTANVTTDINVYVTAPGDEANDVTDLVSSSTYNVTFVGVQENVRVTFLTGQTTGAIVTIVRATPADRLNLYTNTNFAPSMLNQDIGILTLVDQQSKMYDQNIAPHYNLSAQFNDPLPIDLILPILPANYGWMKNSTNTAIIAAPFSGSGGSSGTVNTALYPYLAWYAADGNTVSGLPAQDGSVLASDADGVPTWLGPMTDGQVVIGDTGGTPVAATLTAGDGISITNGAGSITIANTSSIVVQTFAASGTYTPTAGMKYCVIECMGGGAGGGGCPTPGVGVQLSGGGGGAGGYSRKTVDASSIGVSQVVTVSAGGAGAAAGANPGAIGSPSSVGILCVANGGVGGTASGTADVPNGATAGTGDIAAPGQSGIGGSGGDVLNYFSPGSLGGSTQWGAGGLPTPGVTSPGTNGLGYGAGGGGGYATNSGGGTQQPGGNGAPGYVVITEFISS